MDHKEMTRHIRTRVKKAGIIASVSKYVSCGVKGIRVSSRYDRGVHFTPDEQRQINIIALANGLTFSRGEPVREDSVIGSEVHYVYHG